jgi:hypothetical protein
MAKKKQFDAIAASRRWRRAASKRLAGLSFPEQQKLLNRTTEGILEAAPRRRALATARK